MGFAPSSMQLSSAAFKPLGRIPKKHTGEGEDVSPPLEWTGAPAGTKTYALVCHDPDGHRHRYAYLIAYGYPNGDPNSDSFCQP